LGRPSDLLQLALKSTLPPMITTEELIRGFSEESFAGWCRGKFADFVPAAAKLDMGEFEAARQIGYVRTLADGGVNRPLLVAAVQVEGELSERSSRKRQFDFARKALERAAASPPGTVRGVMSQGLFVFHGANGDFRMSLVTGRVEGGKPVYNSFKRQTFFVRSNEVNRTFQDQTAKEFADFKALCGAFSIEALTKQFYKELFAWYEWALSDEMGVQFPNDIHTDTDNRELIPEHVIRLITRLMFTWFIKHKRLVPEEIFRVEDLRKLLWDFDPSSATEGNYYNAILQNLFFATLNNKIEDREFATNGTTRKENEEHYGVKTLFRNPKGGSWFQVPDAKILKLFEKVPFLNGGLFECLDRPEDEKTMRILYYDGFSRAEKVKGKLTRAHVPNGLFFDEARGLIPLFRRYNFTVEENSPNDAEVALDPELLGKVFENLLGAYNPETRETARKQSGSFYTPREIVSYMVDESLKKYLKTQVKIDDAALDRLFEEGAEVDLPTSMRQELAAALRSVKILDLACGSGAFPMGALHRLVDLLVKLEGQPESLYDLKLHLIENCIYGVDIQTIAVQISKLRFFISLICEQEPNGDKADNYGIRSLPNLETKFVAANSLIGLEKEMGDGLNLEDEEIARLREELKQVRHRHFLSKSSAEKQKLRQKDKELRQNIEKRIVSIASTPNLDKIADLEAQIRKLEAEKTKFEGEKWVEKAESFLLCEEGHVEPVVRTDENKAQRKRIQADIDRKKHEIDAEKRKKATDALLEEAEKLAAWNPYDQNASSPFFDPEWMFGIGEGFDVLIGNPPYVRPHKLSDQFKTELWKHFETFEKKADLYVCFIEKGISLLRQQGEFAYIVSNGCLRLDSFELLRKYILNNTTIRTIVDFDKDVFESATVKTCILLLEKSVTHGNNIKVSVASTAQEVQTLVLREISQDKFSQNFKCIFDLSSDSSFDAIKDKIKIGSVPLGDIFDVSFGLKTGDDDKFLSTKPTTKQHRKLLRGEDVGRYTKSFKGEYVWYVPERMRAHRETARPGTHDRFEQPKVLIRDTGGGLMGTFDDKHYFVKDVLVVSHASKDAGLLKKITGVLNSTLMRFFYNTSFPTLHVQSNELASLPVKRSLLAKDCCKSIPDLVDRIINAKSKNSDANTGAMERKIDEEVYALYGLIPEDIEIVEGALVAKKTAEKPEKTPRTVKAKSKSVLVDDEGLD